MLDPYMQYSCAYWKDAETLDDAQQAKLDLICRKLELEPGMRVLDIGCGWGGLAYYMAKNYQVSVVGVTISAEQQKMAQERCADLDVTILLQDYRDLHESFDRIVSVGMFEHVGPKNYATYFDVVDRNLKPDGRFLLHTIGSKKPTIALIPGSTNISSLTAVCRRYAILPKPANRILLWKTGIISAPTTTRRLWPGMNAFLIAGRILPTTIQNALNACSAIT